MRLQQTVLDIVVKTLAESDTFRAHSDCDWSFWEIYTLGRQVVEAMGLNAGDVRTEPRADFAMELRVNGSTTWRQAGSTTAEWRYDLIGAIISGMGEDRPSAANRVELIVSPLPRVTP